MRLSNCDTCVIIGDFVMTKLELTIIATFSALSFVASYFFNISVAHYQQYIAVLSVVIIDGVFGIIAGTRREGFQTRKAIKVLRTATVWTMFLTVLLAVEAGIPGTSWISETIMIPFILFQMISALKNASMAGYIKAALLNRILDEIDRHKGDRQSN
jgi:phage-related holin